SAISAAAAVAATVARSGRALREPISSVQSSTTYSKSAQPKSPKIVS
ncbi:MAG: hypothetical protein QOG33_1111, partial [Gaiellales bacterium]|nr:hypothetical protein [Gaiellales bacterium]